MKLSDFPAVRELLEIRQACRRAMSEAQQFTTSEDGYNAHFSTYADGSGHRIRLEGCYVAQEVLEAVAAVLEEKLVDVDAKLEALGVEVDA